MIYRHKKLKNFLIEVASKNEHYTTIRLAKDWTNDLGTHYKKGKYFSTYTPEFPEYFEPVGSILNA